MALEGVGAGVGAATGGGVTLEAEFAGTETAGAGVGAATGVPAGDGSETFACDESLPELSTLTLFSKLGKELLLGFPFW